METARRGHHVESDEEGYVGLCGSRHRGGDVDGFCHTSRSGGRNTTLVLAGICRYSAIPIL